MQKTAWVIDDHKLYNMGFGRLILSLNEVDNVESFDNPDLALKQKQETNSLSIIMADYFIPGFNIQQWLPQFKQRFPQTPIVIISSSINRLDQARCYELGANAYYEKHAEPEDVLEGLQNILEKTHVQSHDEVDHGTAHNNPAITQSIKYFGFTNRQIDVLIYLTRGYSIKAIALEFEVSTETVKTHASQIYRKLDVSHREDACRWARENGFI